MFFFNLTYRKPLEEIERLLPEHIRYLDDWYAQGKFLCSGRKNPAPAESSCALAKTGKKRSTSGTRTHFTKKARPGMKSSSFFPRKCPTAFRPCCIERMEICLGKR